ncbi:isochorismatase family protein [Peribacillus sp. NPDC046944]|uniref:isochorismatase family protein n=1 Tax=unclassified Peribacillus TaxID=2675266 RepID=UPI003D087B4E
MNTEKNTALLIIDLQIGSFLKEKLIYKGDELLNNIQFLISKARIEQIPIFFTKHNGKAGTLNQKGNRGWEVHPSIPLFKEDVIIEKDFPDSFQQTDLQQQLVNKKISRIIITGIQSEVCVDATCRRAYSLGYEVILAEDGHSTYDSNILNASQIINHHNDIHAQWFANVQKTKDIFL